MILSELLLHMEKVSGVVMKLVYPDNNISIILELVCFMHLVQVGINWYSAQLEPDIFL